MENLIENIISFLLFPPYHINLVILRGVFIVISLFFLFVIFYFLLTTEFLKKWFLESLIEFLGYRGFGAGKFARSWTKIVKKLETANESEYKLAVIGADNMLDNVFKKMGYKGKTLEERLEQLSLLTIFPNIDLLKKAHKIRNNIIYDPDYQLTLEDAQKTLTIYEQIFRDLDML